MRFTLDKYIAARIFSGISVTFIIITGVIMLVDFVERSRDIGSSGDTSMSDVLKLTALNAPRLLEKTIPFVVLFGVMGALFSLNRCSELIIMRASGLSAWRFLRPAVLVTLVLGVIWAIAFNPMAAFTTQKYQTIEKHISGIGLSVFPRDGRIWLREGREGGQVVIRAESVDLENRTLLNASFYYFDYDPERRLVFSTRYDAKTAKLYKSNYWLLSHVTENESGKPVRTYNSMSKTTSITWDTLRSRAQTNKNPPFWQLRREINKASAAGFDATPLIMQYHRLLALPVTLLAMTIVAACASLNLVRAGGSLRLLITGGALGFGIYFVDNIISAFGKTGMLPALLAAWSVPLFVLCSGLIYLSKIEDG